MAGVATLAVVLDRLVFRPLRGRGSGIITMAIASLGIGIALRALVQMAWGPSAERYTTGINKAVTIFWDLKVKPDQFLIVALTLVMALLVYLLLYRTKLGKRCGRTADNPELAEVAGSRRTRCGGGCGSLAGR